jgi:hypothetical protein
MMVATNTYKTIVSESSFDEIRLHLTNVAQSPGTATQDLSESTWKAKREEITWRLMGKVWTEWFPQALQTQSSAYQLDWGSLAQDVGLDFCASSEGSMPRLPTPDEIAALMPEELARLILSDLTQIAPNSMDRYALIRLASRRVNPRD